ncbi:hypothetical protein [Microbulbifer epialgicus]|uniref:Uncharacterized protein n=1 Tax=Microbulbifer epialgicus TaxID=393907 RepID=A0ABV4P6U1_9GAMM
MVDRNKVFAVDGSGDFVGAAQGIVAVAARIVGIAAAFLCGQAFAVGGTVVYSAGFLCAIDTAAVYAAEAVVSISVDNGCRDLGNIPKAKEIFRLSENASGSYKETSSSDGIENFLF